MVYKRGRIWWYKFAWNGESIRESTKQTNKRIAEQIEAAHKTSLAKGEVGIRDRVKAPTLAEFSTQDFLPYIERTYREKKPKTAEFYTCCTANLNAYPELAATRLDAIDHDSVQAFIEFRKEHRFEFRTGKGRLERADAKPLAVSTINRDLATLRKMLKLAVEWGKTVGSPKVRLLPGENRRERALSEAEDTAYLNAAIDLGHQRQAAYEAALRGIRSLQRGQQPRKPDAFQLRDVAITMLDSGIRPDECYRLKPENVREGAIWIFEGKTKAAVVESPS